MSEGAPWPRDANGNFVTTQQDPITGIQMCADCWDGRHDREGCKILGCKCRCYRGRNKGLNKKTMRPKKGMNMELPDKGTIPF